MAQTLPEDGDPKPFSTARVARGAAWAAIDNWTQQLVQLVTFIVIARIVGPEVFGIMTMAIVYALFVHAFLVDGFSDAIVQRLQLDREHLEAAFWALVAVGLVASAVSFSGAELIAAFFSEPQLADVVRWLSLTFVFVGASSLYRGKLRRDLNFRALAIRSMIVHGLSASVGVALALAGYGIWSLVVYQLGLRLLDFVVLMALSGWLPRLRLSGLHLRDLSNFGGNTIGTRIVDVLSYQVDRVLVGYFLDAATLGVYGLARRVLESATNAITGVLNTVALPAFAKLQDDNERLTSALNAATKLSCLITFPVFAGLALVAPVLVETVLGADWRAAGRILQVVCISGFCYPIAIFLMTTLRAVGRADVGFGVSTLGLILRAGFCLIGIRYGVMGIAVATVLGSYLLLPLRFYLVDRLVGIDYPAFARALMPATVSTAAMAACVGAVAVLIEGELAPVVTLAVLVAAGVLTYGASLLLTARSFLLRYLRLASQP